MSADCSICHDTKQVKVGWSQKGGGKYTIEFDPCPSCTPPPHTFHAKQVMLQIEELRALVALAKLEGQ